MMKVMIGINFLSHVVVLLYELESLIKAKIIYTTLNVWKIAKFIAQSSRNIVNLLFLFVCYKDCCEGMVPVLKLNDFIAQIAWGDLIGWGGKEQWRAAA